MEAPVVEVEISRFPCKECAHMPGSATAPGHPRACALAIPRTDMRAFHPLHGVGTQDKGSIAAQWLACEYPCQRFARHLAAQHA